MNNYEYPNNMIPRTVAHTIFKELKNKVKSGNIINEVGICFNADNILKLNYPDLYDKYEMEGKSIYYNVSGYSFGWKHHSGYSSYPVPQSSFTNPIHNKWIGDVGNLRIDLLNYLIRQTR